MNTNLWVDRFSRTRDWLAWTAYSKLKAKPNIEIVYERAIPNQISDPEVVLRCAGPSYIEPKFGYVISDNGVLVEESLRTNWPYDRTPWRIGLASFSDFAKVQRGQGKRVEHHTKVILLRHFWEWNYYHFYLDVLGKIPLFDQVGIDPETPLVLGRYAIELPFVQQIIARGSLKQRNWIVQDDCYIHADEVYFCRTRQTYKQKMNYILDSMGVSNGDNTGKERIFLTRTQKKSGRTIVNFDEILPIIQEYGFNVVDAAKLSVTEQIEIFSRTRYLVAIHGAGMTNMIFRRGAPLSVLEIHASTYVSADFKNMCYEWNYSIDRLACQPIGSKSQVASLYVNPGELRHKLESLLTHERSDTETMS